MFGLEPLTPAYGRVYMNQNELLEAFNSNKDFNTPAGPVTSKEDLVKLNIKKIQVRYGKRLEKTTIIDVEKGAIA